MGGCRCSYKTCKSATKTHQELHFFHYPVKTRERCMLWIHNADRMEFSYLPNDQLRNKVVCGLHFQESCFTNELRKRLVHDAVPTLDVGCDPEQSPLPEKAEDDGLMYMDMQQEGDEGDQAFMTDGSIATIKATSGDGTTFSLDTEPYEMEQKPHLVTYNFVNGTLVPSVSTPELTSAAIRNGNTMSSDNVETFDDCTAIFGGGGEASVQYITDSGSEPQAVSRPVRSVRSNSAVASTSSGRTNDDMESYVLSYVEDPLANDDEDRHAVINIQRANCSIEDEEDEDDDAEDCVLQLVGDQTETADMREVHILPPGRGFTHDALDDLITRDNTSIMVNAEEIVPDNTPRQDVIELIDNQEVDDDVVIVGGGTLFGGDVEMDLVPPQREPIQVAVRTPALQRTLGPAKARKQLAQVKTKAKIRVQQTEIIHPTAAPPIKQQSQQSQPRPIVKQSITYVTTGQYTVPKLTAPTTVTTTRMTIAGISSISAPQRTTAIIKSTLLPHQRPAPRLRTEIQHIFQGPARNTQAQPSTSAAAATPPGQATARTKREVALTSLASLRSELPSSLYSAISIHLLRKRASFDRSETEFLATLYTSSPKGYTTLRKLGWMLPDEELGECSFGEC